MVSRPSFALHSDEVLVEPINDVAAFELRLPLNDEAGYLALSGQAGQPVPGTLGLVDFHECDAVRQPVLFDEVADAGRVGAGPFVDEFELQSLVLSHSVIGGISNANVGGGSLFLTAIGLVWGADRSSSQASARDRSGA
jgi:hypothetical protein